MDQKKRSKRSNVESTKNKKKDVKKNKVKDKKSDKKEKQSDNKDNMGQGSSQSFFEDQKNPNNIICKVDFDKYELEQNEAHKINLHEDLECKPLDDDDEGKGRCVKIKNNKKTSQHSLSEGQNYGKKIQEQSKLSDINSIQAKAHNKNNIDSHENEDTSKSITTKRESKITSQQSLSEGQNYGKKIQEQSKLSDKNSIQAKAHNKNNIDSHENEDTSKSITTKRERWRGRNENKKKTNPQSMNEEQQYHKKVQNQRNVSYKDSTGDNLKKKTAHNRINNDSQKDTYKSVTNDGEERWRYKKKNNNGQKQSRFSDVEESIFEEIDEDIFNLSKDYSLAHCVAEDLRMGAGIAVDFKRIFGGVGELFDQKLKIGDVGVVKRHDQYAFYLITKKSSTGKPTMITMEKALRSLLNKMKESNLTKLGIPKIGCGLDKLDWSDTKLLINDIFSGSGIHITVCVPSRLLDSKKTQKLKVYITPKNLWEMQPETIITLFIDLDKICKKNWTDPIIDAVDAKYPLKENLLRYVKDKKLDPGDIKRFDVKNEIIFCIFTTQSTYYGSLENGFKEIDKIKKYKYLAIQSGLIDYPSDNFQHISWIVLILRSVIHNSELWLCGTKQPENQVFYDEYCKNVQYPMDHSFRYYSPTQKNYRYNDDSRYSFSSK